MLSKILSQAKELEDDQLYNYIKDKEKYKEDILKSYYKLIYKIAKREANNDWELNEYFQIGCLAVLSAINSVSTYLEIDMIKKVFYYRISDNIAKAKLNNANIGVSIEFEKPRKLNILALDSIKMINGEVKIIKPYDQ